MAYGSPGSARAISGRGTGLTPGPESLPSACTNHGCRLATGTGQTRQVRGRNGHAAGTAPACSGARQWVRWRDARQRRGGGAGQRWLRRLSGVRLKRSAGLALGGGLKENEGQGPF